MLTTLSVETKIRHAIGQWNRRNLAEERCRVAVVDGSGSLTCEALYRRAEAVRRGLLAEGVGPGSPVAIVLPRCADYLAAMLGIWACGAYFVPLDSAYPDARLQEVLARSGARRRIDAAWMAANAAEAGEPRLGEWRAPSIAYGIFTSGSTGTPKHVRISAAALEHYVHAAGERLEVEDGLRYAMVSPFTADLGYTGLFLSLARRGTLYIVPDGVVRDPDGFGRYLAEHEIDFLKITPSHFLALNGGEPAVFPRRALVCGGEPLPKHLLTLHRRSGATCGIYNHYGPTETTIGALAGKVEVERAASDEIIALGHPLGEMSAFVLDAGMRPVAPGQVGELYLAGPGVAVDIEPALAGDAGSVLPSVPAGLPARLYRTGDFVCQGEGGYTFVGRRDDQVKVDGFRVSAVQVEQRIAAVLARPCRVVALERNGETVLVAAVEDRAGGLDEASALASISAGLLPAEMPARLFRFESLPLSENGKVDRASIRARWEQEAAQDDAAGLSAAEQALFDAVKAVFSNPDLMLRKSFAQNGGHSLLAMKLKAVIQRRFGVVLTSQQIAGAATLLELVQQCARLRTPVAQDVPDAPDALSGAREAWRPVSRLLSAVLPPDASPEVFNAMEFLGDLDGSRLRDAIHATMRSHEIFQLEFAERDGGWQARFGASPRWRFDLTPLSDALPGQPDAAAACRQVRDAVLDIGHGPHLVWHLFELAPAHWLLASKGLHFLLDTVSRSALFGEISRRYNASDPGELTAAGALTGGYLRTDAAYLALQGTPAYRDGMVFWREYLRDCPTSAVEKAVARLAPAGEERGPFDYRFGDAEMAGLARARAHFGCTWFELYFGLFQAALGELASTCDVAATTSLNLREWLDDTGIGDYSNRLHVRTRWSPGASLPERVAGVIDSFRAARTHGQVHFSEIAERLGAWEKAGLDGARADSFVMSYRAADAFALRGTDARPSSLSLPMADDRLQFCVDAHGPRHAVFCACTLYPVALARALTQCFREAAMTFAGTF